MDIQQLEEEANKAALKQVATMLQRPDQLEKLDGFKKRATRRKTALEAMLKTGVQSQLEGVRTGIGQLQSAADDIEIVGQNFEEIVELLAGFPELSKKMARLRAENVKHSQFVTAMENLKHISNVPETVEKIHQQINDGKLLSAHKNLMELETARDALLFEVHKLETDSEYDKNMLKRYFSEVEKLAVELGKQLWYILSRSLEAVRGSDPGPQQVVTALRIVEREERIDQYYQDGLISSHGFLPPGRPRKWRQKIFRILGKTVVQRIEGNQLEDRSVDKQWLARYLEVCRLIMTDDLRVAKSGTTACFPPEYRIYDRFVQMYHECLAKRLQEIAADDLYKNELVQLLSWVQSYGGDQMLGNPRLQVNVRALLQDHPLLPTTTISQLADKFVQMTRNDIAEWLDKSLQQEKDDWYKGVHPEEDSLGYFYTALPAILFQMVEDQVQLTKEISMNIIPNVVFVNVEELVSLATRYKGTPRANIGINREELLEKIENLKQKWNAGCQMALANLLEEIYQDLNPHFGDLLTKKWANGCGALETICATVTDYSNDYKHLRPHIRSALLMDVQYRILDEYLVGIENRRISFSNFDERFFTAQRLKQEGEKLEQLFRKIADNSDIEVSQIGDEFEYLTDVLGRLSEVLSLRDKSLLALEISNLVRICPDMQTDTLTALVQLREDMGRTEARTLSEEIVHQNRHHPKGGSLARLFQRGCTDGRRFQLDTSINMFASLALKTVSFNI